MDKRYQQQDIETWHQDGALVIPNFFNTAEVAPVRADYERLYDCAGRGDGHSLSVDTGAPAGLFHSKQFMNIDALPYDGSAEMNLLSLHPAITTLAAALLGTEKIHLYQSHTWAKFTGEADYDQPFHCDYGNHTLTVPAEDASARTVNFIIYISDVTDPLGAMHYVPKPEADLILGPRAITAPTEQQLRLKAKQRSAAAPAGSIVAYSIDTFHRGTNMTEAQGLRYTMTVSYKRADNANIGFHVWQSGSERPWQAVINNASPTQLGYLGIPLPGDAFWTGLTLQQCQIRWPDWDMQAYRAAFDSSP